MKTRTFDGKKITIRELKPSDIKNARKFQDFINSLVEEDAMVLMKNKVGLKEEKSWLKGHLDQLRTRKIVHLIADHKDIMVGAAEITLGRERWDHVGILGISIRSGYRRIGLGKYLVKEIIKLAKRKLRPKLKIIRLGVFSPNKPAMKLYQKFGFKKVAKIPKQYQYRGRFIDEIVMLLDL